MNPTSPSFVPPGLWMDPATPPGLEYNEFQISFDDYKSEYEVIKAELLGGGSYGFTRLVRSKTDHKEYALKTMFTKHLSEILSEIWIASRFRYIHIIKVHKVYFHYFNEPTQQDIVDNVASGRWRADILMEKANPIVVKNYNPNQKWRLIYQLISVLSFLQGNGVVYGDIKLDNLLISDDGRLKLIDLGMYYKIGYGRAPVTQSYSDLGGYLKQKKSIYKSAMDKSPRSITYDVIKNAMWALGMTIIEIITEKPLDHKPNLDGVPLIVYEITDNPQILVDILKGNEGWIPLVTTLLIKPPVKFSELLWIPMFQQLTQEYITEIRSAYVIDANFPEPYIEESRSLDDAFSLIYKTDKIHALRRMGLKIPPESKCMGAMYFMYFLLPIGLGLNPREYQGKIIPESTLRHQMALRFVDIVPYPKLDIQNIKTSNTMAQKMMVGLPIFSMACLIFGQAVISNEYEVLDIEWMRALLAMTLGKYCPNVEIIMAGVIYYLQGIMKYTNGNFLLPNPYFELATQNQNLELDLFELSSNYHAYADYMYSLVKFGFPVVSPVVSSVDKLPAVTSMMGDLNV